MKLTRGTLGQSGLPTSPLILVFILVSFCWAQEPQIGGTFRIGVHQRPPSLDWQFTSVESIRRVAIHTYENLLTVDEDGNVIPQLAEGWQVSEDGLTYTFTLRQGVLFHNGEEMTAGDVKSSLDRWRDISSRRSELTDVNNVNVVDQYTIEILLSNPLPALPEILSYPMAPPAIMPSDLAETAQGGTNEMVGTGPYRLVEWIPDTHIRLAKFEDYQPDTRFDGPTGFGGRRTAYLEQIDFVLVEETGARAAGLQAQELDAAIAVPPPTGRNLANQTGLNMQENPLAGNLFMMFNHAAWPTNEEAFRHAILAALDLEEVMAIAGDGLFQLDAGLLYPGTLYHTNTGSEYYDQRDVEKAKQLLEELGYNGEEVIYIVASDLLQGSKAGVIIAQQLQESGINVRIESYDFGTAIGVRGDQDRWHLFQSNLVVEPTADPLPYASFFHSTRDWGFYGDPEMDVIVEALNRQNNFEDRFAVFEQMQQHMWETAAFLPLGNYGEYLGFQDYVRGDNLVLTYWIPRLWNVWLDR